MAEQGTPARGSRRRRWRRVVATIGAVLALLAALIPASIALYNFITRPDPAEAEYQKQVLATCGLVRDTLSANHTGEFVDAGPRGFTINKAGLVRVLTDNLAAVRGDFDRLNGLKTPSSLADEKARVNQAQQALYDVVQGDIQFVQVNVRNGEPLQEFIRQYQPRTAADTQAISGLSQEMGRLAGAECKLAGSATGGTSNP